MTAVSYTVVREKLASTMDKVCQDHNPVIITRGPKNAVVMMSLEDYSSLEATLYLCARQQTPCDSLNRLRRSGRAEALRKN